MGRHRAERSVAPQRGRVARAVLAITLTLGAVLVGTAAVPGAPGHRSAASRAPGGAAPADAPAAGPVRRAAAAHVGDDAAAPAAPPAGSGAGRRVVFAIGRQRVWLVGADGDVAATYVVSGSLTHNLRPGAYRVYSRSRWAVGIDDSGVMQYFVRFARGRHAAIGFHSIPTKQGRPLQTRAQLGTPRSHGCIRQALPDAVRLWRFAPAGTRVVVTA
ncbi:MAG: L,D-transpeptidase [Marmoricola sp.]